MAKGNKPSKQVIIDFIVSRLKLGEVRGQILGIVGEKWETSRTTFDRLLKLANDQLKAEQAAIKKELAAVEVQEAIKVRKGEILTAKQRKKLLSDIALGKVKIPTTEIRYNPKTKKIEHIELLELPGHQSRINAIAELNKMEGDHAPTRTDITSKGKSIKPETKVYKTTLNLS